MDLALFDFDGTVTEREMLPDFFRQVISKPRLIFGYVLLTPLILGYKAGWVSGNRIRAAIVRVGLTGLKVEKYEVAGRDFAENVLPSVIRPEMAERIHWHRSRGDRIIVVSGALDVYLKHWCASQDLELECSRLESRNGRLTGKYLGRQCTNAEKAARVQRHVNLSHFAHIYAYGDTKEDMDLLDLAEIKIYRGKPL